ncbi:MAG: hypothetical protein ACOY82_13605 [Pseudomonadota bacterium]
MIHHLRIAFLGMMLVFCGLAAPAAMAAKLSDGDIETLRTELSSMLASFEQGDYEALLAKTHPVLYDMAGGREALERSMRQAQERIEAAGIRFVSSEMGVPTETYPAGDEELCFVPRVSIIESGGKRIRSATFMIAIRRIGGTEWRYLDGSGLRRDPEKLYHFFPALQRDLPLPPNTTEPL